MVSRRTLLLSTAAILLAGPRRLALGQTRKVIEDWTGLPVGARGIPLGWKKFETFGGRANYDFTIVNDHGHRALDMKAAGDHSSIMKELRVDLGVSPVLLWQWRVVSLPRGADLRERATSDAAGHLFLAWPRFPPLLRSRLIGYVWDPDLPVGSIVMSRKTDTVRFFIVRSGEQGLGQWTGEARDVVADYRTAFGDLPPNPRAIALSIDTNDTQATAETLFGPIAFSAA